MNKQIIFLSSAIFLTACGGGGGDDKTTGGNDNPNPSNPPNQNIVTIEGGSPAVPSSINNLGAHLIGQDSGKNYFKYKANSGDKVFVYAALKNPLTDTQNSRCSGVGEENRKTPSGYRTDIALYDTSLNQIDGNCGEGYIFLANQSGEYIAQFDFPTNSPGYGFFANVSSDSAISTPSGIEGNPNAPKEMSLESKNKLSEIPFFNYFKIKLNANQKIIISTKLDIPLSDQQRARCSSSPGKGTQKSGYKTQIHVYDPIYQRLDGICGENLTFTADKNGYYIFNFEYRQQNSGYFTASRI